MDPRSVLLISDSSEWSAHAEQYLRSRFTQVDWYPWDYGNPHTRSFADWAGVDLLPSFKSDFLVPNAMLERVTKAAINFHPSIPRYRGIGGYRYALDDGLDEFGTTCHHINASIDAGQIIAVSRFRIHPQETEDSLTARTGAAALGQFYWLVDELLKHQPLPASPEQWGPRLYTRKMLSEYKAARAVPA